MVDLDFSPFPMRNTERPLIVASGEPVLQFYR